MRQLYIDISMNASDITIVWDALSEHDIRSLLDDSTYAYQQHPAYGELSRLAGAQAHHAVLYHNQTPIAYLQLQLRRFLRYVRIGLVMRGPVWLTPSLCDQTKAACYRLLKRQHPLRWPYALLLMPDTNDDTALKLAGLRRVISGYGTVIIDLTQTQDSLLAGLDGKWRNALRRSQKSGVSASSIGFRPEQYHWLLDEEVRQSHRIGYATLNPWLVPLYQSAAGSDSLLVLRATRANQTVAGVLCLIHGKTATYHIGWNNDEGRQHAAHNFLMWEAMVQLKQRGVHALDLGGINTQDGAGLTRFKLGTGGQLIQLPGTYM